MRANELRIGNWIMEDYWRQIELQDFEPGRYFDERNNYDNDKIEPISLTPEILEKCGFSGDESQNDYNLGNFRLKNWSDYKSWLMTNGVGYDIYPQMPLIKHLHQLQNLYFTLTGEELNINL